MANPAQVPQAVSAGCRAEFLPALSAQQLAVVARLAREIWYEYYVPIIGQAQVDYMVARFQSLSAIEQQVGAGFEYFLVRQGGADLGYIGLQPQAYEASLFISKLYLHGSIRGQGTGRACMEFIEQVARHRGLVRLWLTVNKGNPAVAAYQRLGFAITNAVVMDIGGGFVMDDYRMEKLIGGPTENQSCKASSGAPRPAHHERLDG